MRVAATTAKEADHLATMSLTANLLTSRCDMYWLAKGATTTHATASWKIHVDRIAAAIVQEYEAVWMFFPM
ncbi:hypothetical protein AXF14_04900 [Actinomyces radicidentis]|uniref:Uncharacterized protein n=1 Tax=Actinomyces radicidentis TaxID=111015 RepID=A0A109W2F5_ACTRD|nr:hypothetical protein AXF14_04900 [Actinomyces radicidentis]